MEGRSEGGLEEGEDFARFGEALEGSLGEEQGAIQGDFKAAARGGLQGEGAQEGRIGIQKFSCQAHGRHCVISRDAELKKGVVAGLRHHQQKLQRRAGIPKRRAIA